LAAPQEHDYPAAAAYLSLTADDARVADVVARLKTAPMTQQKAKDILRASHLPLLPKDDFHVAEDLAKIGQGEALSPVLLVRGSLKTGRPLEIADGYHRVCASYYTDVNTDIPCRIVPVTAGSAVADGAVADGAVAKDANAKDAGGVKSASGVRGVDGVKSAGDAKSTGGVKSASSAKSTGGKKK